eukprot:6476237-Amphidinium_carterae.1
MSDIDLEGLEAQWQQRRELLSGFQGDLALNVSITEVFKGAAIHEGKTLPLMALRKPGAGDKRRQSGFSSEQGFAVVFCSVPMRTHHVTCFDATE